MFSFLTIDGIVDLLAVVVPNPDLLLDVVQELAPDEVLDVGVVPPGIPGIVFAGCDLLLLPGSQRQLHPDEAALPKLPHEGVGPCPRPGIGIPDEHPLEGNEEVEGLLDVLQSLLLVPHGAVDNHVQDHPVLTDFVTGTGAFEDQEDVVIVTIFSQSVAQQETEVLVLGSTHLTEPLYFQMSESDIQYIRSLITHQNSI